MVTGNAQTTDDPHTIDKAEAQIAWDKSVAWGPMNSIKLLVLPFARWVFLLGELGNAKHRNTTTKRGDAQHGVGSQTTRAKVTDANEKTTKIPPIQCTCPQSRIHGVVNRTTVYVE